MALNLLPLLSEFENVDDLENEIASFRTHIPWRAPLAYLHTIYKPLRESAIAGAAERLRMPDSLRAFYRCQNGAHLFAGTIAIFGIHLPGQLLNRSDFRALPFSIDHSQSEFAAQDPRLLTVAFYAYDGSTVEIDRQSGACRLMSPTSVNSLKWPSFDAWLSSELRRLKAFFDERGNRLMETGPPTIPS